MVAKEEPEHDSDDYAENDNTNEQTVLLIQELKHDVFVRFEPFAIWRLECHSHQLILLYDMHQDVIAEHKAVGA